MIAITLQFKSIEAARKALLDIPQTDLVDEPSPAPAKAATEAKPSAPAKPEPVKAAKAEQPKPEPAAAPAEPPAEVIDYKTLQKAVFALAAKSRDAATEVVSAFGVKSFKELSEDKWGAALAAVNDKLVEIGAA